MEFEIWHIWIIVAVLLFILEIFTPAFLAACLAIGCIFAGIISSLDFGINIQLIAFSVGTLSSFFGIRPFILKYGHKKSGDLKTNVHALVGKIGKVIVTIDNDQNQGRISVEGDDWKAESENSEIIHAGEKVEIINVDSTLLTVRLIKKEN
jgi:membrane protein implicated in regulation of membrane protease activity